MQGKFSSLLWIDFVKTLLVARYSNVNASCNMAFTEPTNICLKHKKLLTIL
jgi:hypothetical protein